MPRLGSWAAFGCIVALVCSNAFAVSPATVPPTRVAVPLDSPEQPVLAYWPQPGVVQSFDSFMAIKNEASPSRPWASQHFSFDKDAGEQLGKSVMGFAVDHFLTRVHGRDDDDGDE
jgi:hypothetical protein